MGDIQQCVVRGPNFIKRFFSKFKPRQKGNLEIHAERELKAAGLFDGDSDYGGMLAGAVMDFVKEFSDQGHSGFSARQTIKIFSKVAGFEPLVPLQGTEDEWDECRDGIFQNKRCSHVFKDGKNGQAYDINGKVFCEPGGACYTNKDSRIFIEFPYVPKIEYVNVTE